MERHGAVAPRAGAAAVAGDADDADTIPLLHGDVSVSYTHLTLPTKA